MRSERDPEFVADVPEFIESAAKPVKRHASSAAKTVVRQVLSHAGYPNSTLERLAVQVDKLAPNHPDSLIRQALTEWDQRPEFLETVLGDLIKTSRAAPKTAAADEKVNGWLPHLEICCQPCWDAFLALDPDWDWEYEGWRPDNSAA